MTRQLQDSCTCMYVHIHTHIAGAPIGSILARQLQDSQSRVLFWLCAYLAIVPAIFALLFVAEPARHSSMDSTCVQGESQKHHNTSAQGESQHVHGDHHEKDHRGHHEKDHSDACLTHTAVPEDEHVHHNNNHNHNHSHSHNHNHDHDHHNNHHVKNSCGAGPKDIVGDAETRERRRRRTGYAAMRNYWGGRMMALLAVALFMFMEASAVSSLIVLYISNNVSHFT
jgi:hypothetical protein